MGPSKPYLQIDHSGVGGRGRGRYIFQVSSQISCPLGRITNLPPGLDLGSSAFPSPLLACVLSFSPYRPFDQMVIDCRPGCMHICSWDDGDQMTGS